MRPPLLQKVKGELKSLLMKVKEEREKDGLKQHSENKVNCIWFHHFMANRWRNNGNSDGLYILGSKITADSDWIHEIKRCLLLGRKAMTNLLKSRDITLPTNVRLVKAIVFLVVMYGCESYKESCLLKNWCFWTVVLEKTLESPLDCKEVQPVHSKGDQSWVFIGRTDVEAETSSTLATWCE